jgi:amidase
MTFATHARITLILLLTPVAWAGAAERAATPPLEEASIRELQAQMASGQLTSRVLVEHFLARIQAIDEEGPQLNAIAEINPEAIEIAQQLDAERKNKGARGPLHGIPVLLKDNIDTADRMLTTAGSLALVTSRASRDAHHVKLLRDAGAVILGKTNLSEWANFRSTRSSSGWSARVGQTRNAYDPTRNPCGSSSGSGVAIAAGLAVVAVGTETDGSITCPAAANGIVGIKPTVGLVSQQGIIPIAASQDTAGPMARTVADATILLVAMIGRAENDRVLSHLEPLPDTRKLRDDMMHALQPRGLEGARIGVARKISSFHEGVVPILGEAMRSLTASGAVVIDKTDLVMPETMSEDEMTVLLYEFKDGLNRYLATRTDVPKTLADLIAFNDKQRDVELAYFGQEIFISAQAKGPLTEPEYVAARARGLAAAGKDGIDAVIAANKLDAIVAITLGPAWTTDLLNGDRGVGGDITQAPAVAGYPHITVPAGYLQGMPIGISFVGTAYSEPTLIRLAYAFEQRTKIRKPPVLLPPDRR